MCAPFHFMFGTVLGQPHRNYTYQHSKQRADIFLNQKFDEIFGAKYEDCSVGLSKNVPPPPSSKYPPDVRLRLYKKGLVVVWCKAARTDFERNSERRCAASHSVTHSTLSPVYILTTRSNAATYTMEETRLCHVTSRTKRVLLC